jgi:hypothetical protein
MSEPHTIHETGTVTGSRELARLFRLRRPDISANSRTMASPCPRALKGATSTGHRPSIRNYVKHLRAKAAARAHHLGGGEDTLTAAPRAAHTQHKPPRRKPPLELQRGNLIHRHKSCGRVEQTSLREVRAGVLAIPAQAASRMTHLTNTETATLERLCREALERLAEMPADASLAQMAYETERVPKAHPVKLTIRAALRALKPPPTTPVAEWVENTIKLPSPKFPRHPATSS